MTALDNICDCCHREAPQVWVHASSLVAMSFASCHECLKHMAEMEGTFAYMYDDVGTKGEGLVDEMKYFSTWRDGKYMTWTEWVAWRRDPVRVAELDAQHEKDMEELNTYLVELDDTE